MADIEARKHGEQTGLDTPVVHAVNRVPPSPLRGPKRRGPRLGTTVARLKPKGIGGSSHRRRNMLFNSKLRAQPHQFLKKLQVLHGCRQFVAPAVWFIPGNERNPYKKAPKGVLGITSSLHGPNGLGYRCVTLAGPTKYRHRSRIVEKPAVDGLCSGTRAHEVGVASNRGTARRGE